MHCVSEIHALNINNTIIQPQLLFNTFLNLKT